MKNSTTNANGITITFGCFFYGSAGGVVVTTSACHAGDTDSIPGVAIQNVDAVQNVEG